MIYITIENYSREFEGKFLLAQHLAIEKKQPVMLLPKRVINETRHRLKNATIIHQSYDASMNVGFEKKIINNLNLYILEEEVMHRTITLADQRKIDPKIVDGFFATTQMDYEDLKERYKSRVCFTGHPRFNFYDKELEVPDDIQSLGEFKIFSSNFSMLAPVSDDLLDRVIRDNGMDLEKEQMLRKYIDDHVARGHQALEYLKKLSQKTSLVYRPHPLEDLTFSQNYFNGSSVIISKKYSIYPWLRRATELLHCNCTSAIEARLMGTRVGFIYPLAGEMSDMPFQASNYYLNLDTKVSENNEKKLDSNSLAEIFWPNGILDASMEISKKLELPDTHIKPFYLNAFYIYFKLLHFHIRHIKTNKEMSRYNESEIERVIQSGLLNEAMSAKRIFEAVIVKKS